MPDRIKWEADCRGAVRAAAAVEYSVDLFNTRHYGLYQQYITVAFGWKLSINTEL